MDKRARRKRLTTMAGSEPPKAPLSAQRPWLILGFGLALAAAMLLQFLQPSVPPSSTTTGVAQIGGPFELVDQNGRRRIAAQFQGRYALIYFGYSFCPDVCPTDLAALSAALTALETTDTKAAANVQPIFITVDPQRDTVAALKVFAQSFHPRLIALTGGEAQIASVQKAYHVFAKKNIDPADPKNYLVDHTPLFYLMGPDGTYVAHLAGGSSPDKILGWLKQNMS
jgi:protein SCO1